VGVPRPELTEFLAGCLRRLGVARAWVVHGSGLDELSLCGPTRVTAFDDGEVHTFTVTHQNGVPLFRDALPYVLAYVELEEGPRLMTNIVGCEPAAVSIGMPVVVDFADVADASARELGELGGVFAVPRFRPA